MNWEGGEESTDGEVRGGGDGGTEVRLDDENSQPGPGSTRRGESGHRCADPGADVSGHGGSGDGTRRLQRPRGGGPGALGGADVAAGAGRPTDHRETLVVDPGRAGGCGGDPGPGAPGDGRDREGGGSLGREARGEGDRHPRRVPADPARADRAGRPQGRRAGPGPGAGGAPAGARADRRLVHRGPLPVTGSFAAPGRGSVRADMVFAAPGSLLPLLFVEVDNGTESPPILAEKITRYRRFFARTVTQGGRDTVLWRTVWTAQRQAAHPTLAIVFTKKMNPAAMETRMREVARLTEPQWQGRWTTGHTAPDGTRDGYRDYDGTVPVIVTVLELLERRGPHGQIWWRYGRKDWQTLADALDNPDDSRAYAAREEKRRAAAQAARERQERERAEERRRREAAAWPCPECGRKVYPPGDGWSMGAAPGGLCSVCQSRADYDARQDRERAEEQASLDRETKANGWLGWRGR
ncbi:replication-relaxation family protein [Streptomyces sp. NPDC059496]|uniref:replication-relaxation family protein n=1 Tax=Streptomyces sp. NPDC059496 TaxID=3346851 RepID=UPI003697CCE2